VCSIYNTAGQHNIMSTNFSSCFIHFSVLARVQVVGTSYMEVAGTEVTRGGCIFKFKLPLFV